MRSQMRDLVKHPEPLVPCSALVAPQGERLVAPAGHLCSVEPRAVSACRWADGTASALVDWQAKCSRRALAAWSVITEGRAAPLPWVLMWCPIRSAIDGLTYGPGLRRELASQRSQPRPSTGGNSSRVDMHMLPS